MIRSMFILHMMLATASGYGVLNATTVSINGTRNDTMSHNSTSKTRQPSSGLVLASSAHFPVTSLFLTTSGIEASLIPTSTKPAFTNTTSTYLGTLQSTGNNSTLDAAPHSIETLVPLSSNVTNSQQFWNSTSVRHTASPSISFNNLTNTSIATPTVNTGRLHGDFVVAVAATSATPTSKAKKVFAHYMLGTVTQAHAQQDIDEAIAMGLDGFAFNIGDPSQSFVPISLSNLISYAEYRGFSFYISLDVYASGNACYQGSPGACGGPAAYQTLLADNLGSSAWYKGPNGKPMISTYSSGGETNITWADWRSSFAQEMYFIPDFDETAGYYTAADGWYEYWGDIVDGLFSWEAAWPYRSGFGGNFPGDVSPDLPVLHAATNHSKGYMMALSALQYKDAYGANVYRAGDLNLPVRMENILGMTESPDFIQVITWNDGPESHYIGNLWYEQNNDSLPYRYANAIQWDHSGWQPLIGSFIAAWKADEAATSMAPPSGTPAIGALWYKTILDSSTCPISANAPIANYSLPPDGFDTGTNQLNYAVVIEAGGSGYSINAYSNGVELGSVNLVPGLNYGSFSGAQAGYQQLFLWQNGAVILSATTGRCISAGCPDCVYNMNPQVVALTQDTGEVGDCPYSACQKQVFAHYMVGNVDEDHAHTDIDNAAAMGLDGFALNVGDPTQDFVTSTFQYMFDYAAANHPNFHLFLSMDLWAEGNAFDSVQIDKYQTLLADYKGHPAYLQGPDGNSFASTFSSGGLHNTDWSAWRESWAEEVYLVPDFDDTAGYNTSDPGWWAYWGDIVQGAFTWESAWPLADAEGYFNEEALDQRIIDGTYQHVKSYMMPLSALQYKDSYDTNYYRSGNLLLPYRMATILSQNPPPDFVEYITWNDGPESHYIGNLWLEQNNDTQPGLYANSNASHAAWQPLLTSFIAAFKAGVDNHAMLPPQGDTAVGAIWYNSIMTTSVCPNENLGGYWSKPEGFSIAVDAINYAIVVAPGFEGATLRFISNGVTLVENAELSAGLNYGSIPGIFAGFQAAEMVSASGSVLLTASGGRCISDGCPDCVYNLNPVVVGFSTDAVTGGECYERDCASIISSGSSDTPSGVVYVDAIIYVEPSPVVACYPPCTLVIPPSTMPSLTTISFEPVKTSFVLGGSTFAIVTPLPITTSIINFWNMPVDSGVTSFDFALTTSLNPEPLTISAGGVTSVIDFPPVTTVYSGSEVIIAGGTTYTINGGYFTTGTATLRIPSAATSTQVVAVGDFLLTILPTAAISQDVYTLPTTVVTLNGVTQTFSEAQFTELATITGTTTSTKAVTNSAGTSSTTVIPFWIQVGGFYWSPVPLPTPPYFPIPSFPSFPPIPDPPCFKLFDIFSIDCPPDKSQPTTVFSSGAPSPTCTDTPRCGTLETDSSSSESSECDSATVTVTDYFVSCTDASCTTTRTEVVSGCQVTATTTTTGAYCPAGVTISPNDDQGDDDPDLYAFPESVYVGGAYYTVTNGQIVVDGTIFVIPNVASSTIENIGGVPLTIFPKSILTLPPYTAFSTTAAATTSTAPTPTTSSINPAVCSAPTGQWISPAEATSVASQFCAGVGGDTVPPGISQEYTLSSGAIANFQIVAAAGGENGCGPITVDADRCLLIYDSIFSTCTTDNGQYYGGEIADGCYYYIL